MGSNDTAPKTKKGTPEPTSSAEIERIQRILRTRPEEVPAGTQVLRFELVNVEAYLTMEDLLEITDGSAVGFLKKESVLLATLGNQRLGEVPGEARKVLLSALTEGRSIGAVVAATETEPRMVIVVAAAIW